jgi:ABC-type polar amino acid transport system ATPase subunit
MPVLRVDKLSKFYGALQVLEEVSFEVEEGQKVAVIGPSGSGKTTMLRCINFLEKPTSGTIEIAGQPFGRTVKGGRERFESDRALAKRRADIGFVFQRFNLFSHLTALENVALAPHLARGMTRADAERLGREMLRRVGLESKAHATPDTLSGGQQQRVAIARVLAMQPRLILFDEPTSALDPELVGEVLNVMQSLAADGMTMIIVTHEIRFAADVADRVIFMDKGKIALDGPPRQILIETPSDRVRQFLSSMRFDMPAPAPGGAG